MGSVATRDVTFSNAPDSSGPDSVVPKLEPDRDGYDSPSASSMDEEHEGGGPPEKTGADPPPVPKRKGGRKPIYATSEERKQRNRQAQAAFRERRTEYIKQLESTIQHHEETLQSLQQSHRQAADECLMLRYKNSLLERILLEKGIDVQAELALKGSPHLRPVQRPTVASQASPMQKAMLNRQQQVKQRPIAAPPLQTGNPASRRGQGNFAGSPTGQPTPPSQHSSPSTARSPGFALRGGMTSPASDLQAQHPQQRPMAPAQRPSFPPQHRAHSRNLSSPATSQPLPSAQHPTSAAHQSAYYPSSFQKHYDQLEQEYDAQPDMLDDVDGDEADAESFIPNFRLPPSTNVQGNMQLSPPMTTSASSDGSGMGRHAIDPYDPMLDADPFGLTASMHFPNPFNFQHQPRR